MEEGGEDGLFLSTGSEATLRMHPGTYYLLLTTKEDKPLKLMMINYCRIE